MPETPFLQPADQAPGAAPEFTLSKPADISSSSSASTPPQLACDGVPSHGEAGQSMERSLRDPDSPADVPYHEDGLPWWWFVLFLIMFIVFAAVVVVLVAQGQNLAVAVGVPATLSAVALGALSRLAVLARRRKV